MRAGRPPTGTPPLSAPPSASALLDLYAETLPRLRGAAYRVLVTLALCGGAASARRVTQRSGLCDRAARIGASELEALGIIVRRRTHATTRCEWVCAVQGEPIAADALPPANRHTDSGTD